MKEKIYFHKEVADELGIDLQQLMDFMFEMGLIDENGKATKFALKNGLIVEKEVQIPYEDDPNISNLSLN
jgi:hypothetical protein